MDNRLRIHTKAPKERTERLAESAQVEWEVLPHPQIHRRFRNRKKLPRRRGLTVGETLVRNSAIACALLLTLMAINNVDSPWARRVTGGVKGVVTMRINWDNTLGRLNFVRALLPDTALVYLSGDRAGLPAPVQGELSHAYDERQPWQIYSCAAGSDVWAALDGTVSAVGQGAQGDWIVLLSHEGGAETLYGYLGEASVSLGQTVKAGELLGKAGEAGRIYLEYRLDGAPANPDKA